MSKKIILRGYYGFGNLGDDLLMLVTFNLAKEVFPQHEIIICSNSNAPSYISHFLGEPVTIVKDHDNLHVDWIIHGGGGVYFDFKEAGFNYYLLNQFIHFIGFKPFRKIYKTYRKFRGNAGLTANWQSGLGIGMGSYTSSSKKFFSDIATLASFDFLMVRDQESVSIIQNLGFSYPLVSASDLVFNYHYWKKMEFPKNVGSVKQVGFILRDWDIEYYDYFGLFKSVALQLKANGFNVQFFSFDHLADKEYRKEFSSDFPFYEWNPSSEHLNTFLERLAACNLVVSSRAHGAIISACLGIPSICIAIEPKLEKISKMLKNSSSLISKPFKEDTVMKRIECKLNEDELIHLVRVDVQENSQRIQNGINHFKQFVKKNKIR